jgi:hypothetical protein
MAKDCELVCKLDNGGCKGHPHKVIVIGNGFGPLEVEYCEQAIQRDKDAGFTVEVVDNNESPHLSHQGETPETSVATESAQGVAADTQISQLALKAAIRQRDEARAEVERLRGEREALIQYVKELKAEALSDYQRQDDPELQTMFAAHNTAYTFILNKLEVKPPKP